MEDVILQIEDSNEDFETTHYAVNKIGCDVGLKHIETGEQFVTMLETNKLGQDVKLILLDLNLPGVDGFEVLKVLKMNPETKHLPVIILTTSKDPDDIYKAYALGANCYVQKPVDLPKHIELMKGIYDFWFKTSLLPPNKRPLN